MTNTVVKPLILMAGVAVLATLVLVFLDAPRKRAADARHISFISQLNGAIKQYRQDTGMYPAFETFDQVCQVLKARGYLSVCPVDPHQTYGYAYNAKPQQFQVWAKLQTQATALDSDADINSTGWRGQVSTGEDREYYYDLGSQ